MNDLERYFENNTQRIIHKWMHYFDAYDRHFSRFRGKAPVVLEIGVNYGGSLQMWRNYFGADATIIGTDINPACLVMKDEGFHILLGDQASPAFWDDFKKQFPRIDILIDDGGHTFEQQRVTFECMFEHVDKNGVFLCEDIHTSYLASFGGGFRKPGTFVEYSKGLVDELNSWWSEDEALKVTKLTKACKSIHFYDSIVVLEKGERDAPYDRIMGNGASVHQPYRQPPVPNPSLVGFPEPGSTVAAGDSIANIERAASATGVLPLMRDMFKGMSQKLDAIINQSQKKS